MLIYIDNLADFSALDVENVDNWALFKTKIAEIDGVFVVARWNCASAGDGGVVDSGGIGRHSGCVRRIVLCF